MESVAILGATGSIGKSSLDVISRYPDRFTVYAVTANSSVKKLAQAAKDSGAKVAVIADKELLGALQDELKAAGSRAQALAGAKAIDEIASSPEVDIVIGAIVGAAGISSIKASGAVLMPVDSEHNAIFQCLVGATQKARCEANILLTCSGGPFRQRQDLSNVTVEEATHHPNWSMGKKITVDSATLMNKGLEVIEARWLFDFEPERIQVVVHPQSVIHSMVQYADGVVIAQLGAPDMRNTIAYSLGFPERLDAGVEPLNFSKIKTLTFEEPDLKRFPQLGYAYDALKLGGAASIVLNAANEIGVEAFIQGKIGFTDIARLCHAMMYGFQPPAPTNLEAILDTDKQARKLAQSWVEGFCDKLEN